MLDAVLDALDAEAIRAWSRAAVDLLTEQRQAIDALNVFPVPDSDTGSNVLATIRAGDLALAESPADDCAAALRVLADGAADAAAGNSGFLVSQLVRGLADAAESSLTAGVAGGRLDAATLAAGLQRGAGLARAAVVHPVEGTILTVADAAATAASHALRRLGAAAALPDVLRAAVVAADAAVQRTPTQLAALADAGVVDAGGCALLVLLDALTRVVTGRPAGVTPLAPVLPGQHRAVDGPSFEVQYRLTAPPAAVEVLRAALTRLGDSVVVVGAGPAPDGWNVHAHVDDVGAAIEAGVEAGRPSGITVTRIADPVPSEHRASDSPPHPTGPASSSHTAVLAIAPGPGLVELFGSAGVHVVAGGARDLPTVERVHAAITAARAGTSCDIVLLPNVVRVAGVAEAAAAQARQGGARVAVVPTRSPVQALAAAAVHDAGRRFDDDVVAMAEAAAACRHAEVSLAGARALTAVGICEPGDTLGLIDGEVVEIGRGLAAVAFNVVDRLLGVGAELMTVLVGAAAPPNTGQLIEAHVRERSPFTDVSVYAGGLLDHLVIIGVE